MSAPGPDAEPTTVREAQQMFRNFADGFSELRLYRTLALGIAADDDVARLLLAARPGQARPILLLAALHDLVLAHPELPAARWYPSVTGGPVPDGDPWPDVRDAALTHADRLRRVIATRGTQTNEANRAVHMGALVAEASTDVPDAPVVLLEMGASAGLLLELDAYRIEIGAPGTPGAAVLGDPASDLVTQGELREGSVAGLRLPRVVGRVGLDLAPVRPDDDAELRWLEACLWPDQPERLERFRAAVRHVRARPPHLVRGDMVADLGAVARRAVQDADDAAGERAHLVVLSSWALTYVRPERRADVAATLATLADDGRPVSWVTAEPLGCVPGLPELGPGAWAGEADPETVLGAHLWRDGTALPPALWGVSHPHGAWLHWHGR
ncbi:DUF2332 domain-containing protein [Actinotalea fermentans]|uniref:DUF2332 domain-containing protein n=1 Tax=Actinotalea fermentans TaxID=43671 RepID=A0A511Z154_9CELL|nr:DUF2332 domain-containing protein [Actinotalea fermentans]GEN81169.1 hypothetical protein AFE02nite_29030 [Actinotalea fermentans]